ncbi:MAG: hypothetical protein ACOX2O_01915 [Bdellovibrionota bacterium]|jgi:hypothetical protein
MAKKRSLTEPPKDDDTSIKRSQLKDLEEPSLNQEEANRFFIMSERIKNNKHYKPSKNPDEPYGTFRKRHIIGEHSKINGGVYLGATPQEALVVDDRYVFLDSVYTDLMIRYTNLSDGNVKDLSEDIIVEEMINLVKEQLRYISEEHIAEAIEQEVGGDKKIALDVYIEHRVGTDRHQVLLAAYLLERLINKGFLKGKIYLDGYCKKGTSRKEKLVYSSASGNLFVFSPSD